MNRRVFVILAAHGSVSRICYAMWSDRVGKDVEGDDGELFLNAAA
jgi:hypothetical protein